VEIDVPAGIQTHNSQKKEKVSGEKAIGERFRDR
jgi:hypothetical protein